MESNENSTESSQVKNGNNGKKLPIKKVTSFAKKVDLETAKLISHIKEKLNKKNFGRYVTDSEIIGKAIPLLTQEHFAELQEATLSQQDRLQLAFENYCRENRKVTYEEFLAVLLKDLPSRTKNS